MASDDDIWDSLDVSLTDGELLAEVELTTQLIIAASESDEPMCPQQIDWLLGIRGE
jgi:hypothetical protein